METFVVARAQTAIIESFFFVCAIIEPEVNVHLHHCPLDAPREWKIKLKEK